MIGKNNYNIDIDSLEIKDVIDISLLQKFQDNFAESMDIASITVDRNGNPVTTPSSYTSFCMDFVHTSTIGDDRCAECHRKGGEEAARTGRPYIYTCHAGLIDFAAPILIEGKQIGTILGGQVLTKEPEKSRYMQIAKEMGVDEGRFVESVKKSPSGDYEFYVFKTEMVHLHQPNMNLLPFSFLLNNKNLHYN